MARRLVVLTAIAALTVLALFGAAIADTSDSTYYLGNNGFNGWWDRYGYSHPSSHHRVECEPDDSGWYY